MERRIPLIAITALAIACAVVPKLSAQHVYQDKQIRFSLWAQLDAYPGIFDSDPAAEEKTAALNARVSDANKKASEAASASKSEKEEAREARNKAKTAQENKNFGEAAGYEKESVRHANIAAKYEAVAQQTLIGSSFIIPVARIQEIAPFIISGMLYGWRFDYTPSDKTRGVEEFFAITPVQEFTDEQLAAIRYTKPWIQEEKLFCWVEFDRSSEQQELFASWQDVTIPRIHGEGYARLSEGFAGIQKACEDGIKNAIYNYERKIIKSKPKNITGTVLLASPPVIGIDAGRYKLTLDFFIETDRIVMYKTF